MNGIEFAFGVPAVYVASVAGALILSAVLVLGIFTYIFCCDKSSSPEQLNRALRQVGSIPSQTTSASKKRSDDAAAPPSPTPEAGGADKSKTAAEAKLKRRKKAE